MVKRTARRIEEPERPLSLEESLGRFRLNLAELVKYYRDLGASLPIIARDAGLSGHQALDNMMTARHKGTRIDHAVGTFVNLGVPADKIFLAPQDFAVYLVKEPPSPLPQEPRLLHFVSSPSSVGSGVERVNKTRSERGLSALAKVA